MNGMNATMRCFLRYPVQSRGLRGDAVVMYDERVEVSHGGD